MKYLVYIICLISTVNKILCADLDFRPFRQNMSLRFCIIGLENIVIPIDIRPGCGFNFMDLKQQICSALGYSSEHDCQCSRLTIFKKNDHESFQELVTVGDVEQFYNEFGEALFLYASLASITEQR